MVRAYSGLAAYIECLPVGKPRFTCRNRRIAHKNPENLRRRPEVMSKTYLNLYQASLLRPSIPPRCSAKSQRVYSYVCLFEGHFLSWPQ